MFFIMLCEKGVWQEGSMARLAFSCVVLKLQEMLAIWGFVDFV